MISDSLGKRLVKLARKAVHDHLYGLSGSETGFENEIRAGIFVTLNYVGHGGKEFLRGCIGFPHPVSQLSKDVGEAAIFASTKDPRFPPLRIDELEKITFEVSILTPPQEIDISGPNVDFRDKIMIGTDGLILQWKYGSGLLLPQVPVEYSWDIDEYLANLCNKAGGPPDVFIMKGTQLYKFQADIFKEIEPSGDVIRIQLQSND